MGKLRSWLPALLTALLILAGAVLPRITGWMLRGGVENGVRYAPMQSVRLDIGSNLSVIGKLVLMRDSEALDISASKAVRDREEIEAIARETLEQYQAAGLIGPFEDIYIQARPTMSVRTGDLSLHDVTWAVIINSEAISGDVVMMTIDDATGVVLFISYDTGEAFFEPDGEAAAAAVLWELYFSGLGLDPTQIKGTDTGYELTALLHDETLGYVNICFYIFSSGFFIDFT